MSDNQIIGVIGNVLEITAEIASPLEINANVIGSGPKGNTGDKGDTPVKGVDYFTQTEIDEFIAIIIENATTYEYIHDQIPAESVWVINHPLNKYPSVTIVTSGGVMVIGEIEYISNSQIQVSFNQSFSGKAYLN